MDTSGGEDEVLGGGTALDGTDTDLIHFTAPTRERNHFPKHIRDVQRHSQVTRKWLM